MGWQVYTQALLKTTGDDDDRFLWLLRLRVVTIAVM